MTKRNAAERFKADDYYYNLVWSEENDSFIGRVAEFPLLSAHGHTLEKTLREIKTVVATVLDDLNASHEPIPEPFSKRAYSGKLNLRMPETLHRQLAMEAARQ